MEKILSYIEDTYAPAALFVYGSYADGSNGPDSDFDALALVADGPARHDVSRVGGVQLDLFIHPAADFQGDFPMAEFLRLLDGKLVWDRDGSGKALLEKLAAYRDSLPPQDAGGEPHPGGLVPQDAPAGRAWGCGGAVPLALAAGGQPGDLL